MSALKVLLIAAALFVMLFLLLCQQGNPPQPLAPALLPGEKTLIGFKDPIVEIVHDTECSLDTLCPSRAPNCQLEKFVAGLDTTYTLYAVYYNGDTLTPSCVLCASLYQIKASGDTVLLKSVLTACPTGGPRVEFADLKKDSTYLVAACLNKCGDMSTCNCRELRHAFALVSIRDQYKALSDLFK
ncbi:MAG: hypothetical protein H6505_02365 [Calditrichaeota bacterium]|nr:hypothetical protein [Calditrichota bacterium]